MPNKSFSQDLVTSLPTLNIFIKAQNEPRHNEEKSRGNDQNTCPPRPAQNVNRTEVATNSHGKHNSKEKNQTETDSRSPEANKIL